MKTAFENFLRELRNLDFSIPTSGNQFFGRIFEIDFLKLIQESSIAINSNYFLI